MTVQLMECLAKAARSEEVGVVPAMAALGVDLQIYLVPQAMDLGVEVEVQVEDVEGVVVASDGEAEVEGVAGHDGL